MGRKAHLLLTMPSLPFQTDQMVESRSFQKGFRGAWFRCKIHKMGIQKMHGRNGQNACALKYSDYPDERITWIRLYQKPRGANSKSKSIEKQLMIRPSFPPVYHESKMPNLDTISELIVVVRDVWKVGDLVDWFTDGCYWSGRVTEMLENEKVKIDLLPPPAGEGSSYEVLSKDLRPYLEWSPETGWVVPVSTENGSASSCAQIVKPFESETVSEIQNQDGKLNGALPADQTPYGCDLSVPSQSMSFSESVPVVKQTLACVLSQGNISCSNDASSPLNREESTDAVGTTYLNGKCYEEESWKKMKIEGTIHLSSMCSDSLEAAILDLEELVNKVKWMKHALELGIPFINSAWPSWEFVPHRASSRPK